MSVLVQDAPKQTPRNAGEPQGFTSGILTLAENKLCALQNAFALDGRVSA
jgi:hypothetical protein